MDEISSDDSSTYELSTYDPFSYIRSDIEENRVSNVRELVGAIIPLSPDSKNQFWDKAARKILTGALLYYLQVGVEPDDEHVDAQDAGQYTELDAEIEPFIDEDQDESLEEEVNFYTAIDRITDLPLEKLFEKIKRSNNKAAKKCIRAFSSKKFLTNSEMLMDINETLDTYLMEFVNDMRIKKALTTSNASANPINWETDLDTYNVFLTIPEDKIDQWGSVLSMMLTQLVRSLERRKERYTPEGEKLPPILLLLDEFPRIGKMDVLANALSTLRSKNVTILLLAQSINQISNLYGKDVCRVMLDNCSFKAVLRVDSPDNQRYFSELAGTIPAQHRSRGSSSGFKSKETSFSENYTESRDPFIRPEEFAHLDKELILYTPFGTYRVKKVPYHDSELRAKVFAAD
jgi:type IV secretion system protein VirD4